MAKRPTLTDINSLTNSSAANSINQNWDAIQDAFDNTLSLDGSTPNALNADLDLNGNALLNVGTIDVENLTLDGQTVTDLASVPEWRGAWLTATSYVKNDLVKTAGNVYICLLPHTSGTFATDLTAVRWELMVTKGDSGAGTGDLISTNNLSDLANVATARANLSLGAVATENTVPINKGGTGATDGATALNNLGAQPSDATLTSLADLSLAEGDILYATGPDTLVKLAKGTAGQVLQMNSGATAPQWASGSRVLLASKTASTSASLNFTEFNNASYRWYEFELENVKPATDAVDLALQTSSNGGSSYDAGVSDYGFSGYGVSDGGMTVAGDNTAAAITLGVAGNVGNAANEKGITGTLKVYHAGQATHTRVIGELSYDTTFSIHSRINVGGRRTADQDTDAIRFLFTSGNIASGTIRMYGIT